MNGSTPSELDLILVGGGHAHVAVLRRFAMRPLPGVRLTVVSREIETPYSGMLPGHVAGLYDFDAMHVDLGPLAAAAGADLIRASLVEVAPAQRELVLDDGRPPLRYDVLSLDTGSTPDLAGITGATDRLVPVKPISRFLPRLDALLARLRDAGGPLDVVSVGGGAGGTELTLALAARLERLGLRERVRLHLVFPGEHPLVGHGRGVVQHMERALEAHDVRCVPHFRVTRVDDEALVAADGRSLAADEVLWVTNAAAPAWAADAGLAIDAAGFVAVGPTLQSRSHPEVFAAGDVAALTHAPRPKSGVYAVRAGPVLAANLAAWIRGRPLGRFRPQRRALYLLTTGGPSAVVDRPGWPALHGGWVWRWKDFIDRRFMARYRDLPAMAATEPPSVVAAGRGATRVPAGMRCAGCGSKLATAPLAAALSRSDPGAGSTPFEDAVAVEVGETVVHQTIDGFPLPVTDPFLGGRIAALHALGDLHAMDAEPVAALALATVRTASPELMSGELAQMMAGARQELARHRCRLAGGHSCEGPVAALGLALTGRVLPGRRPLGKDGLVPGTTLILTKALGTGVVLAATATGALPSRRRESAVAHMLASAGTALPALRDHGVVACTDVTGFGLLGHALEMARASGLRLRLDAAAPAALPGALEAFAGGHASSLQPDNEQVLAEAEIRGMAPDDPRLRLLCDPQTCGGLLAGVPAARAEACVAALQDAGHCDAHVVGAVVEDARSAGPWLEIVHGA